MNKLLPGRNHTSILAYVFGNLIALLIFLTFTTSAIYACSFTTAERSGNGPLNLGLTGLSPNTQYEADIDANATTPGGTVTSVITSDSSGNANVTVNGITSQSNIQVIIKGDNPLMAECILTNHSYVSVSDIFEELNGVPYVRPTNTICSYTDNSAECTACLGDGGEGGGVWTALGCIHYGQDTFTLELVKIIIGIASAISLVMMLIGAVLYMTGGGNTEQLKRGRELFTGALVGLLFLIFSVVILQIITRDIIQIDIGM